MPISPAAAFPVGEPITDPLPVKPEVAVFLADAIDHATGEYRSILRGVDPVEGALLEALRVRRRSGSAVLDEGNNFHTILSIDEEKLPGLLRSEIEYAFRHLIERKWIRLVSVDILTEDVGVFVKIVFRNTARDKDDSLKLPLLTLVPRGYA